MITPILLTTKMVKQRENFQHSNKSPVSK